MIKHYKDPNWYVVQEGDATMLPIASQLGQKNLFTNLSVVKAMLTTLGEGENKLYYFH